MARAQFVQFCDDIRQEVGNKVSLIGVYGGDLFSETFPVALPKLGLVLSFVTDLNDKFTELKFRVKKGDEVLLETVVPVDEVRENSKVMRSSAEPIPGEVQERFGVTMHVVVPGFVIEQPSILSAYAVVDGQEGLAGKLRMTRMTAVPASVPSTH